MAHQVHVGLSLSDRRTVGLIRQRLAESRRYRVTAVDAGVRSTEPFANGDEFDGGIGDPFDRMDAILLGREELARFEECDPEGLAEGKGRAKIVLVLGSRDVSDSMGLLRFCGGMLVHDMNLDRVGMIIDLAMLGYFVVPDRLISRFDLPDGGMSRTASRHMSAVERQAFKLLERSNGDAPAEMRIAAAAVNSAARKLAADPRFRDQPHAAIIVPRNGTAVAANPRSDGKASVTRTARSSIWRRTLRDDSGISPIKYAIFAACFGIWAIIALDAVGVASIVRGPPACTLSVASPQCQTIGQPVLRR